MPPPNLAYVALHDGEDLGQARRLFIESLALYRGLSVKPGTADCMEGLACVAAGCGEGERAAVLFGGAEKLRAELGMRIAPYSVHLYDRSRRLLSPAWGNRLSRRRGGAGLQ